MHPPNDVPPSYSALCILDAEQALHQKTSRVENEPSYPANMLALQQLLMEVNPYANTFLHMLEVERADRALGQETRNVSIFLLRENSSDPRRYNDPRVGEVGAVFVAEDGEPPAVRDIVVHSRNQPPSRVLTLSRHAILCVIRFCFRTAKLVGILNAS